jgi:hypothetical protein
MATTTRCARCGREIDAGSYLCERCREEEGPSLGTRIKPPSELEERASRWPPWMPKPSPVQYHATVMVTVFLVIIGLAAFALISHHGVGPFPAHVVSSKTRPPASLVVETRVTNDGSKTSRANCRIVALIGSIVESSQNLLTDPIPPHESITVREVLQRVDAPPTNVGVSCN